MIALLFQIAKHEIYTKTYKCFQYIKSWIFLLLYLCLFPHFFLLQGVRENMSFDISSNLGRDFSKGESVWGDIS